MITRSLGTEFDGHFSESVTCIADAVKTPSE
jgi:hypothetical protein